VKRGAGTKTRQLKLTKTIDKVTARAREERGMGVQAFNFSLKNIRLAKEEEKTRSLGRKQSSCPPIPIPLSVCRKVLVRFSAFLSPKVNTRTQENSIEWNWKPIKNIQPTCLHKVLTRGQRFARFSLNLSLRCRFHWFPVPKTKFACANESSQGKATGFHKRMRWQWHPLPYIIYGGEGNKTLKGRSWSSCREILIKSI